MKTLFLGLLGVSLAVLTGCAPTVISMNPDSVTLRYDPTFTSLEKAQARADDLCRDQYGKGARFVISEPPSKLFIQYATFACE